MATDDARVLDVRVQTDRQRWLGRNRGPAQPIGSLDLVPESVPNTALVTGLDPMCALAVRVRVAPGAKIELTFATAVSDNGGVLSAVIDKYRQHNSVKRASLMSATLVGIRLRALRISAKNFAAMQSLSTALVLSVSRVQAHPTSTDEALAPACDRRLLWRFAISGDRPLILVSAADAQGLGLLRAMAQALNQWAWAGVACDLVVVNSEPASYAMALHREVEVLRERHAKDTSAHSGVALTGFHLLRADELSAAEWSTLKALARFRFHADGRPLAHHVQEWLALHEQALDARHEKSSTRVDTHRAAVAARPEMPATPAFTGEFINEGREFQFEVSERERPPRPWINVLSNPDFGAQVSEAGSGFTWAGNSRLNQLTAWSNDPVSDPPAEVFLLQDLKTRAIWSIAPNAWGDASVAYQLSHGQGSTRITHRRDDLEVSATWCVDADTSVKQIQITLRNHGPKSINLRLIGIAQWMMGANRADRGTVHTRYRPQALSDPSRGLQTLHTVLCTQREQSAGFGDGAAFFSLALDAQEEPDWTCDRRECFDACGQLIIPDYFDQTAGVGLDPCAALACRVAVSADHTVERVFLLGYAKSVADAQQLCTQAAGVPAPTRLQTVCTRWDQLLGATQVKTPDPLLDALLNRWLLYQAVSCRLWAKAAFYQAGGATGFRDQLQDAMALTWAAPQMLRQQIVLCASRQFIQGDVQHWWHAPLGAGVRTHFSDDLLWLPFACAHYLRATGDLTLLDQRVSFIEGPAISPGSEDAYYTPQVSAIVASVYEHAALALDHSLKVGAHGLPLMGTGDWNDGMNQVGAHGQGESVWLAWFLCQLVTDFGPIAQSRDDKARVQAWEAAHQAWLAALHGVAWDGQWFKRAYFDNGQALGSHTNVEARIDLIAQAWAVLSNAATPDMQRQAMQAADAHLVDAENGLIKLLDPPLQHATPSAGYIQAYPPGVRENGGQYSHAGIWALMAVAELAKTTTHASDAPTHCDDAYRYFTYLSPAHRSVHPTRGPAYGLEPYVMAADVYSQAPYVGRGGWSWYTGAAAWMHRAGVEAIFGLRLGASELSFNRCLPSHWPKAEITLVRGEQTMRFILMQADLHQALAATASSEAQPLYPGQLLPWTTLPPNSVFVIPLLMH